MPPSDLHKKKFKTNIAIMGGIMVFCIIVLMVTIIKMAKAEDVVAPAENNGVIYCGEPVTGTIDTESSANFCDMYQRQLHYKGGADQLRYDIKKRSVNFAKPRQQAHQQYKKDLEKLYSTIK